MDIKVCINPAKLSCLAISWLANIPRLRDWRQSVTVCLVLLPELPCKLPPQTVSVILMVSYNFVLTKPLHNI